MPEPIEAAIAEALEQIRVIDAHEHLWDEAYRLTHPGDWSGQFYHYAITSLQMAGMTVAEGNEFYAAETPHAHKWTIFSRYFPLARNTGYLRAALAGISSVYGIDTVTQDSMQTLTSRIQESVRPGFHRQVLRELGNIDYCLVNCFDTDPATGSPLPGRFEGDTELMRPVIYADSLVQPSGYAYLERVTGIDTASLDGWQHAVDTYFQRFGPASLAVKVGLAYGRHLRFDRDADPQAAEAVYREHRADPHGRQDLRPLDDLLMHHVLDRAADHDLAVQFHTGAYSGADYMNAYRIRDNVRDIADLAISRPELRFVAMHAAYPFQDELVLAARQVRNLYAEMSWVWIVDPEAAMRFFAQMLVAAPLNKLIGFGGDYSSVENTLGHLRLARHGMARALTGLVRDHGWSFADAVAAAGYALRHSALAVYEPARL